MRRAGVVVLLAVMWTALWRDASPGTWLAGIAAGIAVVALVPTASSAVWRPLTRPLATLHFLVAFGGNLIRATSAVAWDVITPTIHVREGIIAVPMRTGSIAILTLIANGVTLTPGTVTVDVRGDPTTLYIHVMHLGDVENARREVQRLEELAIRAFGTAEERGRLASERGTA